MRLLISGIMASGKSTVAYMLSETIRYPLLKADSIAAELRRDADIRTQLKELFQCGDTDLEVIMRSGMWKSQLRKGTNSIMHPAIKSAIDKFLLKNPSCIVDAPIPLTLNIMDNIDKVILVKAPMKIVKRRITEMDFTKRTARALLKEQKREFRKIKADLIINNDERQELQVIVDIIISHFKLDK